MSARCVDVVMKGRQSIVPETIPRRSPPADAATLKSLDKPLSILVRLAPEDPRYIDFERNILGKLRRTGFHERATRGESLDQPRDGRRGRAAHRLNVKQAQALRARPLSSSTGHVPWSSSRGPPKQLSKRDAHVGGRVVSAALPVCAPSAR